MEEKKIKNRNGIIIGVIVTIVLLILILVVSLFVNNDKKEKDSNETNNKVEEQVKENDNENNKQDKNDDSTYDLVIGPDYIYDSKFEKISSIPQNIKMYEEGYDIGTAEVDEFDYGFFGYYLVKKNNSYYLMRNQKEVSKIENNTLKIYKDNSDKNSKYTSVICDNDGCSFSFVVGNYGYLNTYLDDSELAIIYNINTGKYKIFKDCYIGNVSDGENNEIEVFWHEDAKNGTGISLIDLNTFELKKLPKNLQLMGDGVSVAAGSGAFSSSSKYIVVKTLGEHTTGKYGLYDYNLNKKIDLIYDDLVTISDDLMIALKGKKYGVINSDNKTIIDFKYDGIVNVDSYYVVLLNNKIGVIDKAGKEIVPINYGVYNLNFSLRHCCSGENSFSAEKKVNQIVVSFVDSTKKRDYERYGYGYSYILINSDNTYKKLDFIDKTYNYVNKYYYYDQVSSNKINIYDLNRKLYTTLSCDKNSISMSGFYDRENIAYSCDEKDYYYNIEQKKLVSENELNNKYKDYIDSVGNLYLYPYGKGYGVYTDNHSLVLEIEKSDKFEHIYDRYYKLTDKENNVQYYYFTGSYW